MTTESDSASTAESPIDSGAARAPLVVTPAVLASQQFILGSPLNISVGSGLLGGAAGSALFYNWITKPFRAGRASVSYARGSIAATASGLVGSAVATVIRTAVHSGSSAQHPDTLFLAGVAIPALMGAGPGVRAVVGAVASARLRKASHQMTVGDGKDLLDLAEGSEALAVQTVNLLQDLRKTRSWRAADRAARRDAVAELINGIERPARPHSTERRNRLVDETLLPLVSQRDFATRRVTEPVKAVRTAVLEYVGPAR